MNLCLWISMQMSILILAAHSLRIGETGISIALAGFAVLIFLKYAWMRTVSMLLLGTGFLFWCKLTAELVQFRMIIDSPWIRLAVIQGVAAIVMLIAFVLVGGHIGRQVFAKQKMTGRWQAGIFLAVVAILLLASFKSPVNLLLLERFLPGFGEIQILVMGLYAAWLFPKIHQSSHIWRMRIWLLFSIVFFVQLLLGLAGVEQMLMTGSLHLPVPALIAARSDFSGKRLFYADSSWSDPDCCRPGLVQLVVLYRGLGCLLHPFEKKSEATARLDALCEISHSNRNNNCSTQFEVL